MGSDSQRLKEIPRFRDLFKLCFASTIALLKVSQHRGMCIEPDADLRTPNLITKRELAARLRKTPRCIEVWMRARYLPYIRIGRSVLFDWNEVVASLKRLEIR